MNRPSNKGRTGFRYRKPKRRELSTSFLQSLTRFHTMGLRIAGFLHQFKTPLHVIQSQTELLLEDSSLSPQTRACLSMIQQNAGRLTAQTQAMMTLAKGSEQTVYPQSLAEMMERICDSAQADCRKKNITLEKNQTSTALVAMDAVALEGAIHNLINNAIESMPKGGLLKVRTFDDSDRRHTIVEIVDNGSGMDKKTLKKVLESPFQSSKATGTGLGLYITRHILKKHHASITWDSRPGAGTKVTMKFPKTASAAAAAPKSRGVYEWIKSKLAVAAILLMLGAASTWATRLPQLLRIKGHFTDSQKVPLTDVLPIHFSIWDTEDGYGNLLWQDVQDTAIQDNTFQVVLGRRTSLPSTVFSGGDRWLEMQIGTDSPLRPRHKIPSQFIQAQVAAAAPPPEAPAPLSNEERREMELQIEKYKDEAPPIIPPAPVPPPVPVVPPPPPPVAVPVAAPVEPVKPVVHAKPVRHHKPVAPPSGGDGELGNVYTVQEGDTLKSIAQKLYGNADLWYDLYYLNRDRLGPMGHLFAGQILVLPGEKDK